VGLNTSKHCGHGQKYYGVAAVILESGMDNSPMYARSFLVWLSNSSLTAL
jgi:hypothetical protein